MDILINGAHLVVFSSDPAADRAFFRDVLNLTHVDAGGGWLIFGLPPTELAVHPSDKKSFHEIFLMCDDIQVFITEMKKKGVTCESVKKESWGLLTYFTLPSGGKLGVYEPFHARPKISEMG